MAAAQVFIALWAASLAVAAPQGSGLRSVQGSSVNQDQVVSQIVVALGPAVSQAVAEALASLNQANSAAAARAASNAAAERAASNAAAERAASNAAAERAAFEADLARDNIIAEPTARPVYDFEYKVADDAAQTYISLNEARDGDDLTGEYSYVDANGGLVTVKYLAGPMGYSETREVQDGFVKITAKSKKSKVDVDAVAAARTEARRVEAARVETARQEAARLEASRLEAARVEAARVEAARLDTARIEAARLEAARLEATRLETVSVDQSSLIAQVLATLQPLISQTVQEAISTSSTSSSSSSSSTSLSSSSTSGSSVTTGDVSSTFGTNGLSVSVETPEFQYTF